MVLFIYNRTYDLYKYYSISVLNAKLLQKLSDSSEILQTLRARQPQAPYILHMLSLACMLEIRFLFRRRHPADIQQLANPVFVSNLKPTWRCIGVLETYH